MILYVWFYVCIPRPSTYLQQDAKRISPRHEAIRLESGKDSRDPRLTMDWGRSRRGQEAMGAKAQGLINLP